MREKVSKNRNKQVERREMELEGNTEKDNKKRLSKEREREKEMSSVYLFKIPGSLRPVTISGTPLSPALSRTLCV